MNGPMSRHNLGYLIKKRMKDGETEGRHVANEEKRAESAEINARNALLPGAMRIWWVGLCSVLPPL